MSTLHLGLDLGGTNIKASVLRFEGGRYEVVAQRTVSSEAEKGPQGVAGNISHLAGDLTADMGQVESFGRGVPGHFVRETGVITLFPNLPGGWDGYPLRGEVGRQVGMEPWLINDARAFTLAEGVVGAGRDHSTVVCMTLGTGIGGGILIDGRLHRGDSGVAGEIGHQVVVPDGPECGCGNKGCVEALAKAEVLVELAGQPSVAEVFEAAARGDEPSLQAIEHVARYIGIGIANVVTILGPGRVVIGGGIAEAGDAILSPIKRVVRETATFVPPDSYEIVGSELGAAAGAVGAAVAGHFKE